MCVCARASQSAIGRRRRNQTPSDAAWTTTTMPRHAMSSTPLCRRSKPTTRPSCLQQRCLDSNNNVTPCRSASQPFNATLRLSPLEGGVCDIMLLSQLTQRHSAAAVTCGSVTKKICCWVVDMPAPQTLQHHATKVLSARARARVCVCVCASVQMTAPGCQQIQLCTVAQDELRTSNT